MAEQSKNSERSKDQAGNDLKTKKVVSLARRRMVQAGLTAPLILTLRSKPLFGQYTQFQGTLPKGCSYWMSASVYLSASYALSHHQAPTMTLQQCRDAIQKSTPTTY